MGAGGGRTTAVPVFAGCAGGVVLVSVYCAFLLLAEIWLMISKKDLHEKFSSESWRI